MKKLKAFDEWLQAHDQDLYNEMDWVEPGKMQWAIPPGGEPFEKDFHDRPADFARGHEVIYHGGPAEGKHKAKILQRYRAKATSKDPFGYWAYEIIFNEPTDPWSGVTLHVSSEYLEPFKYE